MDYIRHTYRLRSVSQHHATPFTIYIHETTPDSKVHGANMGLIWGRQEIHVITSMFVIICSSATFAMQFEQSIGDVYMPEVHIICMLWYSHQANAANTGI